MNKLAENLKKARAKIADPAHWTQRAYARTVKGELCVEDALDAICWCASGAIWVTSYPGRGDATDVHNTHAALGRACHTLYGATIVDTNDILGHAQVLAAFDYAIAEAEK